MITPRFTCTQTAQSVIISIYCPSVRAADVEMHVDETVFTVHINPYFLRLNFSNPLLEDDASSAQYDPSSGYLTVTLTKENKGQEFQDLDLLAKLLAPRPSAQAPVIEVISTTPSASGDDELAARTESLSLDREQEEILKAARNDWQLPQEVPGSLPPLNTSAQMPYGFLDMYSGYFKHVTYTENEINELGSDAEFCSPQERRAKRIKHENEKWDEEHYMADYADDEYIQELLTWRNPHATGSGSVQYTEEENAAMLRLPRKEYLLTPLQTHDLYLTLITLLFSYAYEARATQLDLTPESPWTICSLTPAFSALDPPHSDSWASSLEPLNFSANELTETLMPSYRRSLAIPLYRSWMFSEACRMDVALLLSKGRRTVIRCLLEMKQILDHHETYYVYSKIWIDDFCVWAQAYANDEVLMELGKKITDLSITKSAIGWSLEGLEAATRDLEERDSDSDDESDDDSDNPAPL